MKLKPLADHILIEAAKVEKATKHGIVLPDTASKDRPEQGTVVAVGPGRIEDGKIIPMTVKIGDRVVFKKYGPDEVKIDGKDFLILSESDVLGIVE